MRGDQEKGTRSGDLVPLKSKSVARCPNHCPWRRLMTTFAIGASGSPNLVTNMRRSSSTSSMASCGVYRFTGSGSLIRRIVTTLAIPPLGVLSLCWSVLVLFDGTQREALVSLVVRPTNGSVRA